MKKLVIIFLLLSSTACWALPQCRGDNSDVWHNCIGESRFRGVFAGDRYVGEFGNGTMHGFGTYYFNSRGLEGDVYVGNWVNGAFHGKGTYTWYKLGTKYSGDWVNGEGTGKGTFTWPNGERYIGDFLNGNKQGVGIYTWVNGGSYHGQFNNDLMHGEGAELSADGRIFREGVWEYGQFKYAKNKSTPEYTPPVNEVPESEPFKEDLYDDKEILIAGNGTGFAVTKSGHVITNYHVSNFCDDIYIHYQGKAILATVVSSDSINDLAILKADFKPPNVLPFSRKKAKIMQTIFVAGYPFGKKVSSSIKVTKGIVSALSGIDDNFSDIQVDASIQVGNSGGPIYNEKGNVVAVIKEKLNPKYALKEFGVLPENVNYGVKSHVVIDFLESNNVKLKASNSENISTDKLGEIITGATYYLSCHMTWARIKQYETQKVMFKEFFE